MIEALRLCALPYDDQVQALPEFVFVPDEVVDEFDKAFRLLSRFEAAALRLEAGRSVHRLDRLFQEMSNAPDREWVWSTEAMQADPRWATTRKLAAEALVRLGVPLQRPVFPNSTWVGKDANGEVVAIRGDEVPIRRDESARGDER